MRRALITGITGQDGAYLAEFLLAKGYEVHGIKRRFSSFNTKRVDHLYRDPHENRVRFHFHYGDLTDSTNLVRILQEVRPDEIYNLGAQSHVQVSFETSEYTAAVDGLVSGEELSIAELVEAVRATVDADAPERTCEVVWNTIKTNGTLRKLPDSSRMATTGRRTATPITDGLSIAYENFLKTHA